ncbi:YfhO family protein [Gangjinia marincola]|uniref:YfhO family protein n=1 Tax=Gangjinia marincola TaxID=578463 RepID=A0ABN1MD99_9FLAO
MNFDLKKFLPHILVTLGFVIVALAYFNPVLSGKKIFQNDIVQYVGEAKQQNDFRDIYNEEPYWTDAVFGGMPTYQLGARYPHHYIKKFDKLIRFLPRPADYLFLYFIGIYILLLVLKVDYRLAALGALAFGFSTYLIIILGVGHNAKAHAIAYMPLVLAGIILTFKQSYLWGFLLLALAMGLELNANHPQMTYYLALMVVILGIAYFIDAIKKGILPHYFKSLGVMIGAVLLAFALNATNYLATYEYTPYSSRGGSNLTINPDGTEKEATGGLDFDYITAYSYGWAETFNLFIPRFMGGGSVEDVGEDSATGKAILNLGASPVQAREFTRAAPTYWGDQPGVSAPAYIGASVIFLFVFALYLIKGRLKWWIVGSSVLALLLSYGSNFESLTRFFINYVPFYDKFRAVTSIQVIIELAVPILAVVGLHHLFNRMIDEEQKKKALYWSMGITGGLALIFLFFKSALFDFAAPGDAMYIENLGVDFVDALRQDRKALFNADTLRSLIIVLVCAALVWAFISNKLSKTLTILGLAVTIAFDLIAVDRRYVNNDDFVAARKMDKPFSMNAADQQIKKDTTHFRVFDIGSGVFNGRASYFHHSIGGYTAARPGYIDDLYDFYLLNQDQGVLNMLNVKYTIINNNNQVFAQRNPFANGNAWFVDELKVVANANEEMLALKGLDTKNVAVIQQEFADELSSKTFKADSTSTLRLISHKENELVYQAKVNSKQFAVFSEIYYPLGWNAYIDDTSADYVKVNYALRGMEIPEGEHTIRFTFEPTVIETGSMITLASSILFILFLLGATGMSLRSRSNKAD